MVHQVGHWQVTWTRSRPSVACIRADVRESLRRPHKSREHETESWAALGIKQYWFEKQLASKEKTENESLTKAHQHASLWKTLRILHVLRKSCASRGHQTNLCLEGREVDPRDSRMARREPSKRSTASSAKPEQGYNILRKRSRQGLDALLGNARESKDRFQGSDGSLCKGAGDTARKPH